MGGGQSASTSTSFRGKKGSFKDFYMKGGEELGSGAFSTVHMAVDLKTAEKFAVKTIVKSKLDTSDLAALETEIEILGSLEHKHIIRLTDSFDEGDNKLIVTELVAGGELFDRIVKKSKYTEKEAREVVKILLETLLFLHSEGIVHRDLKPENLLLCNDTSDSDVKFADFGFAKYTTQLLPKEVACGTPGYVAPEILKGIPYGCEVDIWSMGVIVYIILAGYPPFYEDDQRKLFQRIKKGRYHFHEQYWANISPEAIDLIKCMLVVDQKERWTAEQLLKHPWICLDDAKLEEKDLTSSLEVLKKFNGRRRLRAAADAIIMANRMKGTFSKGTKSKSVIDQEIASSVMNAEDDDVVEESESSNVDIREQLMTDRTLNQLEGSNK